MNVERLPTSMGAAALRYVRAGWPVFPCREGDGETYDTSKGPKTPRCKQPYVSNGVKAATTDEATITEWWRRWPNAQIGVAMGRNGLFALDFDPRTDEDTGEVWTLERLKTNLEAMLGCAVPISLVAVTPSGGVHVYLKQPHDDAGDIRNRGVLPDHVDVRGRGGYVIAPPSISMGGENASAGRYRWLEGRQGMEPAEAPATLLEILRTPSKTAVVELLRLRGATDALFDQLWTKWPRGAPAPKPIGGERARIVPDANEAVRAYALKALDREIADLRGSVQGSRNNNLNASSYALGQLVGAGALDETLVRTMLESAAREWPDFAKSQGTIESGLAAGIAKPRDLSEIRADAERRLARRGNRLSRSHDDAKPSQSGVTPAGHSGWGEGEPPKSAAHLDRDCGMLPLTDLGNAKRWFERHGDDFLWVPEWGWLAWDGQRWNRGSAEALVKQSVYSTIEAIGAEAKAIADSGVRPGHENTPPGSIELEQEGGLDFFIRDRRDKLMGLYSDSVRAWGRTSEGAGHIACIDRLAQPWLTARPSDFDADPMLVNLANATMVLLPPREGYPASVQFRAPRRADKVTKLAAVAYDPKAKSPRYDRFLERVQPLPEMRGFLHAWGGYNLTGDISAQKMALFYGEGANGKSTWVDTVAFMLGDYSRSCGIETFIDQGRQRKGGDATPDLAALAGRRMVRTSEPEKGAKFSDGLIKAMTGGEPMNVRELNKEFYEMTVTFKVTCSANIKPTIGTDHGIKRRVRLIPWDEKIPEEEQDDSLVSKLKEEGSGILNHLIAGALHWLDHGLPEPEAVKQATREYQEENDPLARFVELCIMRSDGARVGSTSLFELFKAWQTWAGEIGATGRTWSQKYFTGQMKLKGFKTFQSSTIFWVGIETAKSVHDFIDADGRPIRDPDGAAAPPPHASPDYDDDVL